MMKLPGFKLSINYDDVPTYEILKRFHVAKAAPQGFIEIELNDDMLMTVVFKGSYDNQNGFTLESIEVDDVETDSLRLPGLGKAITQMIKDKYPKDSVVKPADLIDVLLLKIRDDL